MQRLCFSDLDFSNCNIIIPRGEQKSRSFWIRPKEQGEAQSENGIYPTQQFVIKFKTLEHSFDYQIFPGKTILITF